MFEHQTLAGDIPPGGLRTEWERRYDTAVELATTAWSSDYYDHYEQHVFDQFEADLIDGQTDRAAHALTAPPGAGLAAALERLTDRPDLSPDLDDDGLVAMIVAAERLGRWAAAVRGDGVLALWERWAHHHDPTDLPADLERRRRHTVPAPDQTLVTRARRLRAVARTTIRTWTRNVFGNGLSDQERDAAEQLEQADLADSFVAVEASLACGVSKTTARTWLDVARTLATPGRLPVTSHALRTGSLDWPKTLEIVRATSPLTTSTATAVDTLVTPRATLPDPTTSPDDSHRVDEVELRTVPALRDALVAAILALDPDGAADRAATARRTRRVLIYPIDHVIGRLQADLPLEDCARISAILDTAVATARGNHDPRTTDQVRADTLVDLILDGGITTAHLADTLLAPQPATPTEQTNQMDEPAQATDPTDETDPTVEATGATGAKEPAARPAWRQPATPAATQRATRATGRAPVQVTVVINLETLLGLRDDPGYLDHYGPIAAEMARDLATHGTWRCAAVDDTHATVLGLGQGTYRPEYTPTAALDRLTKTTYRHCARPGCRARAQHCDVDHAQPWPDGPSCSCNTHPLCRRDHRLKTTGLLQVQPSTNPRHPPGTMIWTTRTGRRYLAAPPTPLPETPDTLLHAWRAEQHNTRPEPRGATAVATAGPPRPLDHDPPPF
jgi:hypothetical protein